MMGSAYLVVFKFIENASAVRRGYHFERHHAGKLGACSWEDREKGAHRALCPGTLLIPTPLPSRTSVHRPFIFTIIDIGVFYAGEH